MKIIVVNLEKDIERRESIKIQFYKTNLQFEFSKGVLGSALTEQQKKELYNDKKAFRNQCRSLVPAEIGCALSHINIYRKLIDKNIECACILEDDVVLPENLGFYLNEIEKNISKTIPEIILLSPAESEGVGIELDSKYKLRKYKNGFYTSSYIINKAGAKALLKELYPVNDVADCWFRLSKHKVVDINVVVPAIVTQDQDNFGSSTTTDLNLNKNTNFPKKIKFKLCRAFWLSIDLLLALYHRTFRPYAGILKK